MKNVLFFLLVFGLLVGAFYPRSSRQKAQPALTLADEDQQLPFPAYCAEEDRLYQAVVAPLLRHVVREDQGADTTAEDKYYPMVLNFASTLRSLPECTAETDSLFAQPEVTQYAAEMKRLARAPVFATLTTRSFASRSVRDLWKFSPAYRYEPFRKYAALDSAKNTYQLGLQLSRVCFNAARDTGFFFYDIDYTSHIIETVALACKKQGKWTLLPEKNDRSTPVP